MKPFLRLPPSPGHTAPSSSALPVQPHALVPLLPLLLLALVMSLLLGSSPALAADSWSLSDGAGHRLAAKVFEQPFPEYPAGLRLRLNAVDGQTRLDHTHQLVLTDSLGQEWSLPNRSEELVQRGEAAVPAGSAQFDLDALMPRPSEALPLHLTVPTTAGAFGFDLTPEQAMTLHAMGSVPRHGTDPQA